MEKNIDLDDFLEKAVKFEASDIHLKVGERPMVRRDGSILKFNIDPLTKEDIQKMITKMIPESLKNKIDEIMDLDFAYSLPGIARFRVNLSRCLNDLNVVLRIIPSAARMTFENLNLPISIQQFADCNNGIVLVTGPTGSGKSTTLASFVDHINANYQKHIITVEDPIEFVFTDKKCKISQRQVGMDTESFASGIKYALRQDPDVILVGEIRDMETLDSALRAAETGHLVFATLHTNDSVQTICRMINMYPPEDRDPVRRQIAQTLRGTIAQKLVKKAIGKGRLPACEVLVVTSTVKDFIIKNEIESIYDLIRNSNYDDMFSMNASLHKLVEMGEITKEEALDASDDRNELEQFFRGVYRGTKIGEIYD